MCAPRTPIILAPTVSLFLVLTRDGFAEAIGSTAEEAWANAVVSCEKGASEGCDADYLIASLLPDVMEIRATADVLAVFVKGLEGLSR